MITNTQGGFRSFSSQTESFTLGALSEQSAEPLSGRTRNSNKQQPLQERIVSEEHREVFDIPIVSPVEGYKKVLVTGAAGFIGSHAADALLQRGDDVVIIDELNDYYDVSVKRNNLKMLVDQYGKDRVQIYVGDICNATLVQQIFTNHQIQWVLHLAARAGVRPSIQDPFVYVHSNVEGTTRLLEVSRQHKVRNFVYASSSSVYGGSRSALFSEFDRVDAPISPYAASKKSCELMAATYSHLYGLPTTGLRLFTVYGPRGRPDMAPYQFIDRIMRGEAIRQFGDGTSSRDYTYIDDIVDGAIRALDRPYQNEVINLGKGSGTSLKDFIRTIERHTGKAANITQLPNQPGDVPYTCADVSKAERLVGYRSKVPVDDGIRRTVEWYREAFGSAGSGSGSVE